MNISIIGSCQSREIFNLKNTERDQEIFQVSSYFPNTSMLSVMSEPVLYNYRRLLMSGMDDDQMEEWYNELEKPILKILESKQPDALLLDFCTDAKSGARSYGSEYIVNRIEELAGKGIINGKNLGITYSYEQNTSDFIMVWKNFFDRFMAFMSERLPDTQIIVNSIRGTYATIEPTEDSVLNLEKDELNVWRIIKLWKILDDYAIKKYGLKFIPYGEEYCKSNFQKLEKMVKVQKNHIKDVHVNLLSDSSYKYNLNYWSNMAGKYEIVEYSKYRALRVVDCREELGDYRPQIWSRPIEIEGSGETPYTLSFYIKIPDMSTLDADEVLFRIRTFSSIKEIKANETIDWYRLTLEGHPIKENEEYRYTFTFTPKGNYLKLAPFMFHCVPGVEYSRIKLERSSKVSEYTK